MASSILVQSGCKDELMPERCSKCYVLLNSGQSEIYEYEQYIPKAQDWAYLNTEIIATENDTPYIIQVDRNIFMIRNSAYLDSRGVVSFANYLKTCRNNFSPSDTLYALLKSADDRYTEYVVKDFSTMRVEGDVLIRQWRDGSERIQMVHGLQPGESSTAVEGNELFVQEVREMECLQMTEQRIVTDAGTMLMTHLEDIGPIFITREDGRDIRLATVNKAPLAQVVAEACE